MMIKLSSSAHEDLKSIYEFIKNKSVEKAKKEIQIIYDAVDNLKKFKYIGKKYDSIFTLKREYRRIIVKRKYVIFYYVEFEQIIIYRILKTNQDYLKLIL